jgi:hypothetical protein
MTRYVVDYDLPADFRRKRFYRSIRRYLRSHGLSEMQWSTGSVVFTDSEAFARYVHGQALKVGGKANVYRAELMLSWP